MRDFNYRTWPTRTVGAQPECYIAEGEEFVAEAPSYSYAEAWIQSATDLKERLGEPTPDYRVIPVRATPGGRDIR